MCVVICASCQDLVVETPVTGNFYLVATDTRSQTALSYKLENGNYIGVIDERIDLIGFDDKYLIAKKNAIENNESIYFILPIKLIDQYWPKKNLMGPLDYDAFLDSCAALGINENLELTIPVEYD